MSTATTIALPITPCDGEGDCAGQALALALFAGPFFPADDMILWACEKHRPEILTELVRALRSGVHPGYGERRAADPAQGTH